MGVVLQWEAAMTQHHPVVWLRTRATTRKGRPSKMALGRATDAVSDAGSSVGGAITHAGRSVVNAIPGVGGDDGSVESLLAAAHRASDEARAAEQKALGVAEEAKRTADEAKRTTRAARQRATDAERDAKA